MQITYAIDQDQRSRSLKVIFSLPRSRSLKMILIFWEKISDLPILWLWPNNSAEYLAIIRLNIIRTLFTYSAKTEYLVLGRLLGIRPSI